MAPIHVAFFINIFPSGTHTLLYSQRKNNMGLIEHVLCKLRYTHTSCAGDYIIVNSLHYRHAQDPLDPRVCCARLTRMHLAVHLTVHDEITPFTDVKYFATSNAVFKNVSEHRPLGACWTKPAKIFFSRLTVGSIVTMVSLTFRHYTNLAKLSA